MAGAVMGAPRLRDQRLEAGGQRIGGCAQVDDIVDTQGNGGMA